MLSVLAVSCCCIFFPVTRGHLCPKRVCSRLLDYSYADIDRQTDHTQTITITVTGTQHVELE